MSPHEFVALIKEDAIRLERESGLPAAVTIAQAALETGWGRHVLAHSVEAEQALKRLEGGRGEYANLPDGTPSFNLFAIKRHRSQIPFVVCWDRALQGGRWVRTPDRFRRYASYAESMADRNRFLRTNPRYAEALSCQDPFEFATKLQEAGYAEDPDYAAKLHSIMRTYVIPQLT